MVLTTVPDLSVGAAVTTSSAPALTQAQASDPSSTTQGTVSGSEIAQAVAQARKHTCFDPMFVKGQTSFTLPFTPLDPDALEFTVNGHRYYSPDISAQGVTVTWNGPFVLDPNEDDIRIVFR